MQNFPPSPADERGRVCRGVDLHTYTYPRPSVRSSPYFTCAAGAAPASGTQTFLSSRPPIPAGPRRGSGSRPAGVEAKRRRAGAAVLMRYVPTRLLRDALHFALTRSDSCYSDQHINTSLRVPARDRHSFLLSCVSFPFKKANTAAASSSPHLLRRWTRRGRSLALAERFFQTQRQEQQANRQMNFTPFSSCCCEGSNNTLCCRTTAQTERLPPRGRRTHATRVIVAELGERQTRWFSVTPRNQRARGDRGTSRISGERERLLVCLCRTEKNILVRTISF